MPRSIGPVLHRAGCALLLLMALCAPGMARAGVTPNLILNGDAETGDLTGWTDVLGQGYSLYEGSHSGSFCFWGGLFGPSGPYNHEIVQDVPLGAYAALIDAGSVMATFTGWGRANEASGANDHGSFSVEYRSESSLLQSYDSGLFTPFNAWVPRQDQRVLPAGTRIARIRLFSSRGFGLSSDGGQDDLSLVLESPTLSVGDAAAGRAALRLVSSNPARGDASRLAFAMPAPGRARVAVLDVSGRTVRVLFDAHVVAGERSLQWDGRDDAGTRAPAGLYFVRLESPGRRESVRVVRVH